MRKIPRTVGRVQFGSPRNFLNPIISKFDKHVVLLPINKTLLERLLGRRYVRCILACRLVQSSVI